MENPEVNPYKFDQPIFSKGAKPVPRWKDSLFNKWYQNNYYRSIGSYISLGLQDISLNLTKPNTLYKN